MANRPSASAIAEPATTPSRTASTATPGSPCSVGSITPDSPPPPVVKSTQTVPAIAAGSAAGDAAARAFAGIMSGAMATSPSSTTSPGANVGLVDVALPLGS